MHVVLYNVCYFYMFDFVCASYLSHRVEPKRSRAIVKF